MPYLDITKMSKSEFVEIQLKQTKDKIRPFVRCGCLKKLWIQDAYKCLYCKEWFCEKCAEEHFGETIEARRMRNLTISTGG